MVEGFPFFSAFLIVALAFLVKATTGFGENLIMIPVLSFFSELKVVLPTTLTVVLVADAYLLMKWHRDIHWLIFWRFLIPAVIGIAIGSIGLQYVNEGLLETVLGGVVMVYGMTTFLGTQIGQNQSHLKGWNYTAGLLGGGFSGLLGIGGPPVIAFLNYYQIPKQVFRATCVITFFAFDLFRLGAYTWKGFFTWGTFFMGLVLLPAFGMGTLLGMKLHSQLNEQGFNKMVAILLIGVGGALLV